MNSQDNIKNAVTNEKATLIYNDYQTSNNIECISALYEYCKKKFDDNIVVKSIQCLEDREDIFHEVIMYIIVHKDDFDHRRISNGRPTSFAAWFNQVIRSKCLDFYRKGTIKSKEGTRITKEYYDISSYSEVMTSAGIRVGSDMKIKVISLNGYMPSAYIGCEEAAIKSEEKELLYYAQKNLNERYKKAVQLYYYNDCSEQEIAVVLNTSVNAVKKILLRARKQMKNYLLEQGYGNEAA